MGGKAKYLIPGAGPVLLAKDALKKGSSGKPVVPNAPMPSEGATSALETELAYRPRFREQDVQDILGYAEASAQAQRQFGFPLAEEERALYERLEPETFAVQRKLAQKTLEQLETPLTPGEEETFRERFRSEEALGGRLGSPVGSASIARNLADVTARNREMASNRALSYLGRTSLETPQLPTSRGTEFGQFVSPYLSQQSAVFGTQGNIYATQQAAREASRARRDRYIGAAIKGAGTTLAML